MFDVSPDLYLAVFYFGLHTLIVWSAVLTWLWFSHKVQKLADKRRRQHLSG